MTTPTHTNREPSLAVIVPVLHEPDIGAQLNRTCAQSANEIIVVHAGDTATTEQLHNWQQTNANTAPRIRILQAPRGRALQMNAGAAATQADVLLFLHADTILPDAALAQVRAAIVDGAIWGRFDVRLSGTHLGFRWIERCMNSRSAWTGIVTGDQALFVRRDAFVMLGGFAPIALMEDIELSARLKGIDWPYRLRSPVVTSSRRWQQNGILRTVLKMWALRALYACGVSPARLAQWYK
ncbi:MAG: TIGR04283 family arsenosugar biosynthesis glycosyltransferase [Gammaproteobacteria bacterium]|nr:TIGR04283 family arsenosugar biosynthesis glycosyltransferase [Gammaproteobacteria bacterium]